MGWRDLKHFLASFTAPSHGTIITHWGETLRITAIFPYLAFPLFSFFFLFLLCRVLLPVPGSSPSHFLLSVATGRPILLQVRWKVNMWRSCWVNVTPETITSHTLHCSPCLTLWRLTLAHPRFLNTRRQARTIEIQRNHKVVLLLLPTKDPKNSNTCAAIQLLPTDISWSLVSSWECFDRCSARLIRLQHCQQQKYS